MARRQRFILVLILVAVALAGFVFGRVVLPRIILRILEHEFEPQDGSETSLISAWAILEVLDPLGWRGPRFSADLDTMTCSLTLVPVRLTGGSGLNSKVELEVFRPMTKEELQPGDATSHANPGTGALETVETEPEDSEDAQPDVPSTGLDAGGFEDLWIEVDVTEQLVRIMGGDQVIKEMIASTGKQGHETPLGTFEIQNRGEWFFSEKYQQGAKYWVSFRDWGLYLFHSVVMDRDGNVIQEEAEKLGQPASHGCVRLSIEDAKWIYDNVPEKTKVVIHK